MFRNISEMQNTLVRAHVATEAHRLQHNGIYESIAVASTVCQTLATLR